MTGEAVKGLIRRYYEGLWNRWELTLASELLAPDVVFRGSLGVTVEGRDGFLRYVGLVRAAFPDFHNTIEDLIVEGDRAVARLTYRGELFGVAATGAVVTYSGAAFFRVVQGRIVEGWVLGDLWAVRQQIGATTSGSPTVAGR